MQVRLLFLFRSERSTIYGDRKLQIAVLCLDHLIEFSFARLLCLKEEGPAAMVCGLHLDFILDNLSDKFIRVGTNLPEENQRLLDGITRFLAQ